MGRASIRDQWKAKLEGKGVSSKVSAWELNQGGVSFVGQVLGVDPSLRGTGLSLIEFKKGKSPIMLRCQTVTMKPKIPMSECLGEIFRSVTCFLDDFTVDHVALEQTIYVQNFQTAQILGAARGAATAAAAVQGKPIFEYA
ncbi:MAG: crossover junction endodeoxyribonuclease RuvC, partial [Opitutaceae bacterium]|nr:crossover junction endodeoxyribonuclease RuvC [Opitutaceae bacterium]